MSQSPGGSRSASDIVLTNPSKVNLSRNTSVISTVSSSSSLDVPPVNSRIPMSDTALIAPDIRQRPPAWLSKRFNNGANGQNGTLTPKPTSSPAPLVNGKYRMSSPDDFEFGDEIGGGSWSIVVDGTHVSTGKHYAIKILNKAQLVKEKMSQSAVAEKNALATLSAGDHPGVIKLFSAFQDSTSLYFVLSLAPNGDLRELVKSVGSFSTNCARYYAATIVDTVQWMHTKGVLHRDLKPENILLDADMRIRLADFGSAYVSKDLDLSPRSSTFVGTAAYVSPELLGPLKVTSASSDIWAIGCIIYFLLVGQSPFLALTDYLSFKKIEKLDYTFMEGFDPDAKDLIQHLIVTDPASRLGISPKSTPQELRDHPFFIGRNPDNVDSTIKYVNWDTLWVDPPAPIESGLVQPPVPLPGNDKLVNGLAWDDFINAFSIVAVDQENSGQYLETPRFEAAEKDLYPEEPRTPTLLTSRERSNTATTYSLPTTVTPTIQMLDNKDIVRDDLGDKEVLKTIIPTDTTRPPTSLTQEELKIVNDPAWSSILLPHETILRAARVEVRIGRRPFQRTDHRILVLTTFPRVLCVKTKHSISASGALVLKQEFLFPKSPVGRTGKRLLKASVESGASIVLETSEKTYIYRIFNASEAQLWLQQIRDLL